MLIQSEVLRPAFDRRIKLEFHGARITSDGGLLAYRELDDILGLAEIAITKLFDGRRGKNVRHQLGGLFRQSVFGRLAGYEDLNDAGRLARDPAMRAIVGRKGLDRLAASSSQMGRFETEWLATGANLEALTDLSGAWIDRVHEYKPPDSIILDMDSSESPTHGEQEGSAWNGHFGCFQDRMNEFLCNPIFERRLEMQRLIARQRAAVVRGDQHCSQDVARQEQGLARAKRDIDFRTLATLDPQPHLPVERSSDDAHGV